ncbi:MAG: radical SAM protein, partial [Pseudobdellovibrio sp.]
MPNSLNALQAVEIEINHACNRSCTYCPNSILERKTKGIMSLETYEMVIKNLVDLDFSGRISYDFYNEPMLHPQFTEIVRLTKKILPKSKIHLYSNGTLLTENKFQELVKNGIDKFVITQHEQDENKENYIFNDVFKSLDTADREKVI